MNHNDIIDRLREIRSQAVHQPTVIALRGLIAQLQTAQDEVTRLKDELAEIQRPLDAQMARLNENLIATNARADALTNKPIDMVLHCPACGLQHIDASEYEHDLGMGNTARTADAWTNPPHRSHLCHGCGHIWRPADVPTNGVAAVKTRGQNDSPIAQPRPGVASSPDFDAIKGKRMSELTPAQERDALELWLRNNINGAGRSPHDLESHVVFLLKRLDEARGVKS